MYHEVVGGCTQALSRHKECAINKQLIMANSARVITQCCEYMNEMFPMCI